MAKSAAAAAAEDQEMSQEEINAAAEAAFDEGFEGGEDDDGMPPADAGKKSDDSDPDEKKEAGKKDGEDDNQAAAAAGDEPPPWAKSLIERMDAQDERMKTELRKVHGRLGEHGSKLKDVSASDAKQAAADVKAGGGDAPSQRQIADAFGDQEAMQELSNEFPEWNKAMVAQTGVIQTYIDEQIGEIKEALDGLAKTEANEDTINGLKDAMVTLRHKGWQKTVNGPEFKAWIEDDKQRDSVEVMNLYMSNDPLDVIDLLDRFEESRADQANNGDGKGEGDPAGDGGANSRLEAAEEPTRGSRQPGKREPYDPNKAFDEGYETG